MAKILLIEDNRDMRENIAEILELDGYEVTSAENGKIGVKYALENTPDLIVCDIMMPELDGYGVLKILSKKPETASIPFIYLTAKSERDDFRTGMSLGADDYLVKPFNDIELIEAVELRLRKSKTIEEINENTSVGTFISEVKLLQKLDELDQHAEEKSYLKKQSIYEEGKHPKKLFHLKKGKVKCFRMNDEGKELITKIYNEGDYLGYLNLFTGETYKDSAVAFEESTIVEIGKKEFDSLIHSDRSIGVKFIELLAREIDETEERLISIAYDSVRRKVADALLYVNNKYNEDNTYPFTISILRDDLSKIIGIARETVIRVLSDFKDEGVIQITSSKITIPDKARLENIVS